MIHFPCVAILHVLDHLEAKERKKFHTYYQGRVNPGVENSTLFRFFLTLPLVTGPALRVQGTAAGGWQSGTDTPTAGPSSASCPPALWSAASPRYSTTTSTPPGTGSGTSSMVLEPSCSKLSFCLFTHSNMILEIVVNSLYSMTEP